MEYFREFVSDCAMGSGNQSVFYTVDPKKVYTCRTYYRLTYGGEYRYSLLYSNIVDSTFADGSISHKNRVVDSWRIHDCRIGVCERAGMQQAEEPKEFYRITFGGQAEKTVAPAEFFSTDPISLSTRAGDYLCVELSFSGRELPCHPESWLPAFIKDGNEWKSCPYVPFASMVGCDRKVSKRLIFMGDSITQGIGTAKNSYRHLAAQIARKLGPDVAVWDIGLGYGRANDAASDGAWLYKARQADAAVICYGVNDLFRVQSGALLKEDLTYIVRKLKKSGLKVLLQTIPPFDYNEEKSIIWEDVNRYILEILSNEADAVFDVVPVLGTKNMPSRALYGGHPNEQGNTAWTEALYPSVLQLLN